MEDDIIICRCEEVTLGELRAALESGAHTAAELKNLTRVGMGTCEGRTCRQLVSEFLAIQAPSAGSAPPSFRPPLRPVTLGEWAMISRPDESSEPEVPGGDSQ